MPSTSCENSTKVANAAIDAAFMSPRMIAIGRSSGCRISQRTPSLNSDLNDWGGWSGSRWARNVPGIERHERGGEEERAGIDEERQREGAEQEQRSERGTGERVHDPLDAPQPAVRLLELAGMHDVGHDRLRRVVPQHLGHAQQEGRQEHEQEQSGPGAGDGLELVGTWERVLLAQHGEGHEQREERPQRVHRDHRFATVDTIGDDARRQREDRARASAARPAPARPGSGCG